MPVQPCPACDQPIPRQLEVSRDGTRLHYYWCKSCGVAWTKPQARGGHAAGAADQTADGAGLT